MSFADDLKELAYEIRAIPGELGMRPYSAAILLGTWSGTNTGRGDTINECLPLLEANGQNPKIRQLTDEEIALGGLGKGSIRIGPITPAFAGGGTSISTLQPCVAAGQTVHVILTGPEYPNGAKFAVKSVGSDHALHYTLDVSPVSELGP